MFYEEMEDVRCKKEEVRCVEEDGVPESFMFFCSYVFVPQWGKNKNGTT